jgi:hypothetical protein
MSLQTTLEPLLARLWDQAWDTYVAQYALDNMNAVTPGANRTPAEQKRDFDEAVGPALSDLTSRFRGYYTLDGFDLAPVADQFVTPDDRWEDPRGNLFGHIVQATRGVHKAAELLHSDLWRNRLPSDDRTHWSGAAALAFQTNFLDPFDRTAATQAGCAREIAIAARTLAQAVELAKEAVVWICNNAIWLLSVTPGTPRAEPPGALPGEEPEGRVRKVAGMTAILADTAALFLALIPGVDVLDLSLASTGVIGGMVAESQSPTMWHPIADAFNSCASASTGALAIEVINAAHQALAALDTNIVDLDDKIRQALDDDLAPGAAFTRTNIGVYTQSQGEHSGGGGWSGYPELSASDFQRLPGRGDDTPFDYVVAPVVDLYYAGFVTLPLVADQFDFGFKVCDGVHVTGVDRQFQRSVPKLNEAAETLGSALRATRDHCIKYGEAMVTAAKAYEYADADEGRQIREVEMSIPKPDPNLPPDYTGTWPHQ